MSRIINLASLFTSCAAILAVGMPAAAATPVLGAASRFAVLGGSTVTNTGPTTITGDLGVWPGTAITGMGTITLHGASHAHDAVSNLAHDNARLAFTTLAGLPSTMDLSGSDLGGMILNPGVYRFSTSAQLTGDLTLDFGSHPDGEFVFQIGSTLTSGSGANVFVLNGGPTSAIYWNVGTSATLGSGTTFAGNVIADQSITLVSGTRILCGRSLALVGAVTMDTNTVSNDCTGAGAGDSGRSDFGSHGFSGGTAGAAVPEPAAWSLMLLGFGGLGALLRRRRGQVALPV